MNPVEQATNATAVGAISLPLWLPPMHSISATFAEWAPTIGSLWIIAQLGFKLYDRWYGRKE